MMKVNRTGIVKLPLDLTDDIAMKTDAQKGRGATTLDRDIDLLGINGVRHLADHGRDQSHRMFRDGIGMATKITNGESKMIVLLRTTPRTHPAKMRIFRIMSLIL
jgi:hypothetical protein